LHNGGIIVALAKAVKMVDVELMRPPRRGIPAVGGLSAR
jgi:hypothetical protein